MKRILNYPGSKWNIASWIIENMPDHEVYLEPYFGSGAVFFNKHASKIETINDIDSRVVNLFQVIRDRTEELCQAVEFTPLSREEQQKSFFDDGDDVERARRFLVRCWQSIGAKTSDRTGWRSSISKRGVKGTEWASVPERIVAVATRLKDAQIENQSACNLIQRYNKKDVLIYADPPYPFETRGNRHYAFEMQTKDHVELLELLKAHKGPVILSSYENDLYNQYLDDWHKEFIVTYAEKGRERIETIYINPIAYQSVGQMNLFEFNDYKMEKM
ncbi:MULTISPECIES: DNA adenine methylase [Listeria]|nr:MULTISPECIES: DNA adenine methylase [Listeria]MBC1379789.1 DNA adenine methylase [Listeria innocua]MBC1388546.1 DNA adenine methylase [Listeria innocua]MBF2598312.1 DNA adenine methylase [Listeria welshimeri]MBF2614927.1 DNA adenine methylase [Listeria welshimeri]